MTDKITELNSESYKNLVDQTYKLIMDEMEYYSSPDRNTDLSTMYPKFVVMYQFFRMLRGEAFVDVRPHTPEFQHEYYDMENKIRQKLEELKSKVDLDSTLTPTRIKEMQDKFNL